MSATLATAANEAATPDRRDDLVSVARGGALNIVGTIMNGVSGFLLGIIVTRGLHARGAGVFFEAIALFTITTTIAQLGADIGVVREIPRHRALGRFGDSIRCLYAALAPIVAVATVVGVAMYVFAPDISHAIVRGGDEDAAVPYLRVLGPFLPIAAVSKVVLSATRAYGTMLPFVAVEYFGKGAVRPVLAIFVVALGFGSLAMALSWALPLAAGLVAGAIWLVAVIRRASRTRAAAHEPHTPVRDLAFEFWRFTAFRGVAAIFAIAILWLQVVLVGALASAREAGVYGAASRFVTAGSFALQALFLVMGPQMSALLSRGQRDRAQEVYQAATAWLTAVSFPIFLTMAVFAPFLLRIFGPDFVSGQTALEILALAMLVNVGTGTVTVILLMSGKSSWNLANTASAAVVNVGLNVILIPRLGMTGAAIAWAAAICVQNLVPLAQIWFSLKIHPFGAAYRVPVAAAAICFGGLGLLITQTLGMSISTFLFFGVVATSAYVMLLWRFREVLDIPLLRAAVAARRRRPAMAASG
jgi:O-antigen/teichoic acid export membrane protein